MQGRFPRTLLALFAALALALAACEAEEIEDPLEDDPTPEEEVTPEPTPDETPEDEVAVEEPGLESDEDASVMELLAEHDEFSELVAALEDTGLADELEGDGPFTVFAPTNDAFDLIPDYQREEHADDPDLLEEILRSHVAEEEITAEELSDGDTLSMLDGSERTVLVTDEGEVYVGSAQVVEADARAANGVIHAIDFVLAPSPPAEEPEEEDDEDENDDADEDEDEDA